MHTLRNPGLQLCIPVLKPCSNLGMSVYESKKPRYKIHSRRTWRSGHDDGTIEGTHFLE